MTNKTVRPIMTVEARDVLDVIHSIVQRKDRSESVVSYFNSCRKVYDQNEVLQEKLSNQKRKVNEYKILSGLMTAACIALVATMMITGV
ncbi:coil containing protein [Vibrio phage 1.287.O._10N.286.55.C7]|nr:coil containing protein [Vibrio phage 1.287.O._10N.286.55.C7]